MPLRTINDIANRRGYWVYTAEFNELRESYGLYLRKFILDDAMALSLLVMKRFGVDSRGGHNDCGDNLQRHCAGNVKDGRTEVSIIMETEKYLSTSQLMDYLEISRSTVYRLMAKGMPNILVGSVHRFPKERVVEWLASQSGNKLDDMAEC